MANAWKFASGFATAVLIVLLVASVLVLTRPHAGHRGPAHWKAATILLLIALACDVIASVGYFTAKALER